MQFINEAKIVAKKGTCLRKQVGAIICKDGEIIAKGFNTSPNGFGTCKELGCLIIDGHCLRTVHGEMNALLQAGKQANNATMFCTTLPCVHCIKAIIQSGISKLVYIEDYNKETVEYWLNVTTMEIEQWKKN